MKTGAEVFGDIKAINNKGWKTNSGNYLFHKDRGKWRMTYTYECPSNNHAFHIDFITHHKNLAFATLKQAADVVEAFHLAKSINEQVYPLTIAKQYVLADKRILLEKQPFSKQWQLRANHQFFIGSYASFDNKLACYNSLSEFSLLLKQTGLFETFYGITSFKTRLAAIEHLLHFIEQTGQQKFFKDLV